MFRQHAPPPSAETIAAHRREVEKLAAAGDPVAKVQVEMWAKADAIEPTSGPVSVSKLLPLAAKYLTAAAGERIVNPKIQDADVDKYRAPNFAAPSWWKRANAAIAKRSVGDVLRITLKNCCNALARRFNWGHGSARLSMETLAGEMGCCEDTARKAVRYLQRYDVINVMNTLVRREEDNLLVRWTNLYLATRPEQAPLEEPAEISPKLSQLARAGAVAARWASYFVGLVSRDLGLNKTPLAGSRRRHGDATRPA